MIPISTYQKKKVCIVTVVRDENRFLDEWLCYHKIIGIDHFFIYDNNPDLGLGLFLHPHREYVTIVRWHEDGTCPQPVNNQIRAFNHACLNFIREFTWVIFLDVDEFVTLKKDISVDVFLNSFEQASAVTLNWAVFGHSGLFYDSGRLITSTLTRRKRGTFAEGKSFTKTDAILSITSPHFCNLKYGERLNVQHKIYEDDLVDSNKEIAVINHYPSRSFSTWMKRAARGDVNFNKENCPKSELWRLDEAGLLNEFVTNVAFDWNEKKDNYLSKYRFGIQKMIITLRNRSGDFSQDIETELNERLNRQLNKIAKGLAENSRAIQLSGSHDLKIAAVMFLFYCFRHTGNQSFRTTALALTKALTEEAIEDVNSTYVDRIMSYGIAIEYLTKHGFLDINTNNFLEDIDILVYYQQDIAGSIKKNEISFILHICSYLVSRLNNPFNNLHHPHEKKNLKILSEQLDLVHPDNYDLFYLTKALHVLTEAYQLESLRPTLLTKIHEVSCVTRKNLLTGILDKQTETQLQQLSILFSKAALLTGDDTFDAVSSELQDHISMFADTLCRQQSIETDMNRVIGSWLYHLQLFNIKCRQHYKERAIASLENYSLILESLCETKTDMTDTDQCRFYAYCGLALLPALISNDHILQDLALAVSNNLSLCLV